MFVYRDDLKCEAYRPEWDQIQREVEYFELENRRRERRINLVAGGIGALLGFAVIAFAAVVVL